ncbi:MAG: hypothetical protein HZB30_02180 [Nitrospirae bacterium]|nr:hypothetical protein [Nitrospirota bacterium]
MENITGTPVVDANYLKTRLFLVDELRGLTRKTSIIIEAPRRYGKTSVVKEFVSEENKKPDAEREFNILFFELEGEETINHFCYAFFKELLNLYSIRKKLDMLSTILGDFWNTIAKRLPKIKIPQFEIELREQTRDFDFSKWREKIEPLIFGLNSFEKRTVIVFDEFPDMLINFKNRGKEILGFKEATDTLTAWLRSLRQKTESGCKYQFVFCGSINLRKTLEDLGIGKRINDLETLRVPPMKSEEALLLIKELMKKYQIEIDKGGIEFMADKITDGSPYYGQILFKALRDARERKFTFTRVQSVYDAMLRGGDHDLNHFHARLQEYLVTAVEKECSTIILKHLCSNPLHEKQLYDSYLFDTCSNEVFQSVVNRLIYEGYIMRDTSDRGKLKFVSPLLKDWWACKTGGQ